MSTNRTIEIIQGRDINLVVTLTDKVSGEPMSLAGFTAATASFAGTDADVVIAGSVYSADRGKVLFEMDEDDTAALEAGDEMDIEVVVDQGDVRTIAQIIGKLVVKERLFTPAT